MRLTITGEYPANWKDIAARVKTEAGNRCVRCGHPDGDRMALKYEANCPEQYAAMKVLGENPREKSLKRCDKECRHPKDGKLRALTVHHLDGNKSNCDWWNLLALCQKCHLTIQAKVVPERPFLWEHSDWFKPYAAGFYAHWHGGLEDDCHCRTHITANLDHYLRLGQPWLYDKEVAR